MCISRNAVPFVLVFRLNKHNFHSIEVIKISQILQISHAAAAAIFHLGREIRKFRRIIIELLWPRLRSRNDSRNWTFQAPFLFFFYLVAHSVGWISRRNPFTIFVKPPPLPTVSLSSDVKRCTYSREYANRMRIASFIQRAIKNRKGKEIKSIREWNK